MHRCVGKSEEGGLPHAGEDLAALEKDYEEIDAESGEGEHEGKGEKY